METSFDLGVFIFRNKMKLKNLKKKIKNKRTIFIVLGLIIIASFLFVFQKYRDVNNEYRVLIQSKDFDAKKVIAENPKTSIGLLTELAKDESPEIRGCVAGNNNSSQKILKALSKDEYPQVRAIVAKNRNTPQDILIKLSEDEDTAVRIGVARNSNINPDLLEELSKDKDPQVRMYVVRNIKARTSLIEKMADDEDSMVRIYIAKNPNVSRDILIKLSKDEDPQVRAGVAGNIDTETSLLEELFQDDDDKVLEEIAKNLNTHIDLVKKVLIKLAKSEDYYIREFVAQNKNTPIEALYILADDSSRVSYYVAQNPNTTIEILEKLVENKNWEAIDIVTEKRYFTENIRKSFIEIIKSGNIFEKQKIVYSENIPEDLFLEISNVFKEDYDSLKYEYAAKYDYTEYVFLIRNFCENSNTPINLLEAFSKDEDFKIREMALGALKNRNN